MCPDGEGCSVINCFLITKTNYLYMYIMIGNNQNAGNNRLINFVFSFMQIVNFSMNNIQGIQEIFLISLLS